MIFDLVVIGGGAAGFFGALHVAQNQPGSKVLILEKTSKLLTKVAVSGGGRCNVTHDCVNPFELSRHYPRGERPLKSLFKTYNAQHVVDWFSERNVSLKTENDGRMFPVTDSSQTIVDCFVREATRLKIGIETNKRVIKIVQSNENLVVETATHDQYLTRKILLAPGGSPQVESYAWIAALGHPIVDPIPSLFTFNDADKKFKDLMGIAVQHADIKIQGTKFMESGPVLITHWGLSGPAVIKLSAWAAAHLHQQHYKFDVRVNWIRVKEDVCRQQLLDNKLASPKQKIFSHPMYALPHRLWQRLCELSEINVSRIWNDVSLRDVNRLVENLVNSVFHISGKTTFKEEFVTCGGVDLKDVDLDTMESKLTKNVYFAGEVLNIDGETGGFNFQAAWTTAFIAAKAIAS
jgi:predicted Rossmann fold flavoprotein